MTIQKKKRVASVLRKKRKLRHPVWEMSWDEDRPDELLSSLPNESHTRVVSDEVDMPYIKKKSKLRGGQIAFRNRKIRTMNILDSLNY